MIALGYGIEALCLWLIPTWIASGALGFVLDWIPHHPHTNTGRWTNARILDCSWLTVPMLGQNYHLVHHLWPRVPFYRYGILFHAQRELLISHGSPIVSPGATIQVRLPRPEQQG